MKAKEEYVDVPRETRSKDITVYAIIFLVLLVGAGIFLAGKLLASAASAGLCSSLTARKMPAPTSRTRKMTA